MSSASPEHDQAVAQLGELLARRRLGAARDILSRALPRYPDSTALLQHAAWIDWLEDRLEDALETLDKILAIDPSSFDARFLLARIQSEQNRLAEAEVTLLGLLQDYPEEPALFAEYARIMLQSFNVEKAQRLANEALKRDPSNSAALNVNVLCAFIGSPGKDQRERLHKLLHEHPDQTESAIRIVQMLIDHGKHREAYELTRELVLLDPANEHLAGLAHDLRRTSHWSMLPLWPMQKWGWAGSIGIWVLVLVILRSGVLDVTPLAGHEGAVTVVVLVYVAYSWIWPPLLGKLLR